MKRYLIAALAAASFAASADSEFRQGADFVRITARPCSDATVMESLAKQSENPLDYRAAMAEVAGVIYQACWKPVVSQGVVFLVYSDGDQGLIPIGLLKPVKEA